VKNFNFHTTPIEVIESENKLYVYDRLRKKKLLLTPEEEVRQKLIWYFINERGVPGGLIALERSLKINGLLKRFDLVVFNNTGNPYLAVECKSPSVPLSQNVLQQLAIYNLHLKAEFLMVSNGLNHLISQVNFETREIRFLEDLPF